MQGNWPNSARWAEHYWVDFLGTFFSDVNYLASSLCLSASGPQPAWTRLYFVSKHSGGAGVSTCHIGIRATECRREYGVGSGVLGSGTRRQSGVEVTWRGGAEQEVDGQTMDPNREVKQLLGAFPP